MPDMELQRGEWGLWQLGVHIGGSLAPTDAPNHEATIARLVGEYYARGQYMSTSLAPQATTGVYDTLRGDPAFPPKLSRKRTVAMVRNLKREGILVEEPYKRANRAAGERWMLLRDPDSPFRHFAPTAQTGTG